MPVTKRWSQRHKKVLYVITVPNKSDGLIYDLKDLRSLRDEIDHELAQEGTTYGVNR